MENENVDNQSLSPLQNIVDKSIIEITWDSDKSMFRVKLSYQTAYGNFPDNYWTEEKWCCYTLIGEAIDRLYMDMLMREIDFKKERL